MEIKDLQELIQNETGIELTDEEAKVLLYYSVERKQDDLWKIILDSYEGKTKKDFNNSQDYFWANNDNKLKDVREFFNKFFGKFNADTEFKDEEGIEKKYKSRKKGFGDFKNFLNWYFSQYKKQQGKCYYCGMEEKDLKDLLEGNKKNSFKSKKFTSGGLQIERKVAPDEYHENSDNGYTIENCVLACALCNNAKSDLISSDDFMKFFAKPMQDYLEKRKKELKDK
ncbi:MAG: hypothetical protein FWF32_02915 [Endomicrobia bacterium]|nr:hypothetical protein [Endomicrobiia bacterium]